MMMPVLFVGHGSPMNAVEDNELPRKWREISASMPIPKCILCVSAHWMAGDTFTSDAEEPQQIYDMYGFPKELYDLKYEPPGSRFYAGKIQKQLGIDINNDWGIDHGTWSVLTHMYPEADIPVVQVSLDMTKPYAEHYAIGQKLRQLREEGVLIIGSGNVVHNLRLIDWRREGGFAWAYEFDHYIRDCILRNDHKGVMDHPLSPAVPTTDHFLPLLYVLGASNIIDKVEVFNQVCQLGSLSMTGYLFYR